MTMRDSGQILSAKYGTCLTVRGNFTKMIAGKEYRCPALRGSRQESKKEISMKIAIGNDHSAVELKNIIVEFLQEKGHEVLNLGVDTTDSCDYPVYGEKVGRAVASGEADLGIAICGTGLGISLAANKVKGVRACVCSEPYTAVMSRKHNNANVLCFGARVVGSELAKMIVEEWLNAEFEGGRHQRRVDLIMEIENR